MTQSVVSEISNNLMFRYRIPCLQIKKDTRQPEQIGKPYELPEFCSVDDGLPYATLRAAWSETGMYFWIKVEGKKQSLWCKRTQLLESDGLQLWIDTRDTHNLHRATKFCHWFLFLPQGDGHDEKQPIATMLKINRAREHSPSINQAKMEIACKSTKGGYTLSTFIPGAVLNGWNPNEHKQIGFSYSVYDREMGLQHLSVGSEYPVTEDPSLWHTLELN